jgi:hypothetical protein
MSNDFMVWTDKPSAYLLFASPHFCMRAPLY